jgi:hypothetical protein
MAPMVSRSPRQAGANCGVYFGGGGRKATKGNAILATLSQWARPGDGWADYKMRGPREAGNNRLIS